LRLPGEPVSAQVSGLAEHAWVKESAKPLTGRLCGCRTPSSSWPWYKIR
jgi:hypothetical protein